MYARKESHVNPAASPESEGGQTGDPEGGPDKLVTARAPVDLIERMRGIAVANDRTFSAEVRRAIRDYVEAYEDAAAA